MLEMQTMPNIYKLLLGGDNTTRECRLGFDFRIKFHGMFTAVVDEAWSSAGRREADYFHHIDISLSGRRSVVFEDRQFDIEPGQISFFPGNMPVARQCEERCEVVWFEFELEHLPGIDPLMDWPRRSPRLIARCDTQDWRPWLTRDRPISVNEILSFHGQLLIWIAQAFPELEQIFQFHLDSHGHFEKVFKLIESQLGGDLRISTLAEANGTTVDAFTRAFNRHFGLAPRAYVSRKLNQKAMELLLNTDLRIREIASTLRFSDEFYFSRFFTKLNRLSPSAFRAKHNSAELGESDGHAALAPRQNKLTDLA